MHRSTSTAKTASLLSQLVKNASLWFGRSAAQRRGRRNEPVRLSSLALEGLEERALMAVDVKFASGVLTVAGDASNNTAVFSGTSASLQAKTTYDLNGTTYTTTKTYYGVNQIKFYGNAGNDVFTNNTAVASAVYGGAGDDRLNGGSGNDSLLGEAGSDVLNGGAGNDAFYGGDGDDFYVFLGSNQGKDVVADRVGLDALDLRGLTVGATVDLSKTTAQTVAGSHLSLTFNFADAVDDVYGTNYNDAIVGNAMNNRIWGLGGNDNLSGGAGDDVLQGGDGVDTLGGGAGDDALSGGGGDDALNGGDGNDTLLGDAGNDVLQGQGGADALTGGDGNDWLYGDGYYYVGGQADAADKLYGGAGDDYLAGGAGDDLLYGQAGIDTFNGGLGWDRYNDDFTLFVNGASIADVQQGESGVCTILAAIGTSFDERAWTNDVRYVGGNQYDVRLFNQNGTSYWERTTFDGTWSDDDARPGVSATGVREAWTIIVQRAVLERHGVDWTKPSAQWAGGWQYLDVGLQAIHGGPRSPGSLSGTTPAAFDQLVAAKNVTVGSKPSGTSGGIATSHAYAVLDVYFANGQWFVNLFNPWGVDGQSGAISGANDGMITLSWSAFTANFTQYAKA